jgi:ascorbate-specific PTS system EIIC-type component UlaA
MHVAFAFFAMGAWAAFANREHGLASALLAGAVQGALSAAITLALKKAVDFLSKRFQGVASLVAPPLIACSVSLGVLAGAHFIARTPEIAATIAVPFSIAFGYASLYSFGLWRMRRKSA